MRPDLAAAVARLDVASARLVGERAPRLGGERAFSAWKAGTHSTGRIAPA
jgi:hypothetical protein